MGHGHDHGGQPPGPVSPTVRRALLAAMLAVLALVGVGVVALWPARHTFATPPQFSSGTGAPVSYEHARVVSLTASSCGAATPARTCVTGRFRITSGQDLGRVASVELARGPGEPVLQVGDNVLLARTTDSAGQARFYFDDFDRRLPLAALTVAFVVLAVVVGRRRGLASLLGLGFAFGVLVEFLLPGLLSGGDPVLTAVTAGGLVMVVVLYLSHGVSARTTVAVLGTLLGLGLVGVLGRIAVLGTHLTGLSSDELTAVQSSTPGVNVAGLLLAGLVIGSLGVLNDVTVTQASAVWELHGANPDLGRRALYLSGMRIGRDHIASTIYTLLLAYAGAALPVLLVLTLSHAPLAVVLNGDLIASDIVRSLVGGIGLLLAVPITTALAAACAATAGPAAPRPGRRHAR